MGYAMMGHLIFGTVVTQFKTFPDAITTCLEVVMGDPSINTQLRKLPGLMVCPLSPRLSEYHILWTLVLVAVLLGLKGAVP